MRENPIVQIPTLSGDPVTEVALGPESDEMFEELLVEEISIDGMCGVY